jgi:GT2 family glycosyltransferase
MIEERAKSIVGASTTPCVNVVIRTLNEADWIKHCLLHVLRQSYEHHVITVVDSGSTDGTQAIVNSFVDSYPGRVALQSVSVFKPGDAINVGALLVESDYFICLSAHCIPSSAEWISQYVEFMECHQDVAGAYGKQLPLSCTHPDDARDLAITFGNECRLIERDYFFHNANSIIRNSCWEEIPFDGVTPHIEDRIWAKQVLSKGWRTAYLPQAGVYHYHGLHQHGSTRSFRASNVLKVMSLIEDHSLDTDVFDIIGPDLFFPTVILVPIELSNSEPMRQKLALLVQDFPRESEIYVVDGCNESEVPPGASLICRSEVDSQQGVSLRELMRNILSTIEQNTSQAVDAIIFYDLTYTNIDSFLGKKCTQLLINSWLSAVMPAWRDHGNYWVQKDGGFENLSGSYDLRENKSSLYRTILGQGAAIRASVIRSDLIDIPVGEVIWSDDEKILVKDKLC